MISIKPEIATKQQSDEIERLRVRMMQVYSSSAASIVYDNVNKLAERDHRVEVDHYSVAVMIFVLRAAKNVHYDNSYSKRGLFSIFFNMERKWERLAAQLFNDHGDAASETFVDTIVDLAAYAIGMVGWLCARQPAAYIKLLQAIDREAVAVGLLPTNSRASQTEAAYFSAMDSADECEAVEEEKR
jgi:hypothetical protein